MNIPKKRRLPLIGLRKEHYKVSLDKYYTYPNIAAYCYQSLITTAKKYGIDTNQYTFLEPSSGDGAFYNLLPQDKRVGIDIEPSSEGITRQDFFDWKPDSNTKYITIGNPPFGARGWLALAFINKASEFSDLVGFILPMYFDSVRKGQANID